MKIPTKDSDPSGLVGAVGAVASAVFGALVVFGSFSPEEAEALLQVVVTSLPIVIGVVAWLIRRWAYAPDTVNLRIQRALMVRENVVRNKERNSGQ